MKSATSVVARKNLKDKIQTSAIFPPRTFATAQDTNFTASLAAHKHCGEYIFQPFTFLSVSRFTCNAISVFSLFGSNVCEFRSPPPVLIRPLKHNTIKGLVNEKLTLKLLKELDQSKNTQTLNRDSSLLNGRFAARSL